MSHDLGLAEGKEIPEGVLRILPSRGPSAFAFDGATNCLGLNLKTVRQRIAGMLGVIRAITVVTSRIVGYDKEVRYDGLSFQHHRVARLTLEDIEAFVGDWYRVRIENKPDRQRHAGDLVRIVRDVESRAIRELAENPLLLTIICLVHRIDAVLPDERVVLYQKCTETLLNTWHTWKFGAEQVKNRNKIERRNRGA